jgi:hypothetical protein
MTPLHPEVSAQDGPLTDEESRRRAEAVRFANASIALEGFFVSAEAAARAEDFIAGRIELAEFVRGAST